MRLARRHIDEGDVVPFGYGVAWVDHARCEWVCLPLGVNMVAAAVRRFYHWAVTQPVRNPSLLDVAFFKGREYEREYRRQRDKRDDAVINEIIKSIAPKGIA